MDRFAASKLRLRLEADDTVLDNLTLLAIIIIIFWVGALAYYFYISRQQNEIRKDLDALREKLDETEELDDTP